MKYQTEAFFFCVSAKNVRDIYAIRNSKGSKSVRMRKGDKSL